MLECPECGGYNTVGRDYFDPDSGEWWHTEWTCRDCGAEWVEDGETDDRDGEA